MRMNRYIGEEIAHIGKRISSQGCLPSVQAKRLIELICDITPRVNSDPEMLDLVRRFVIRDLKTRGKHSFTPRKLWLEKIYDATTLDQIVSAFHEAVKEIEKPGRALTKQLVISLEHMLPGLLMDEDIIELQRRWIDDELRSDQTAMTIRFFNEISYQELIRNKTCQVCNTLFDPNNMEAREKWAREFQERHGGLDD